MRHDRPDEFIEGQLRDSAWGLFPERNGSTERRITTTNGFEFFVDSTVVFTFFEITERA